MVNGATNQSEFNKFSKSEKRARASYDWFCFTSHWLRKCWELCQPIRERSKANPKQRRITFYTDNNIRNRHVTLSCNKMRQVVSVSSDTYSLYVVLSIHLLVLRMRAVITCAQRQEHDIFASGFLQGQGHGNTATFASHVGINSKHCNKDN